MFAQNKPELAQNEHEKKYPAGSEDQTSKKLGSERVKCRLVKMLHNDENNFLTIYFSGGGTSVT